MSLSTLDLDALTPAELDALLAQEEARLVEVEAQVEEAAMAVKEATEAATAKDRDVVAIHNLHTFLALVWNEVDPAPFVDAWFIELICEEIQNAFEEMMRRRAMKQRLIEQAAGDEDLLNELVAQHMGHMGQIKLVLAVPPRHGKTTIAKIIALAWAFLRWPELKFVAVGAAGLTEEHGPKLRRLIQSETYQRLATLAARMQEDEPWTFAGDQNTKTYFDTTRGGKFLAQSIGTGITGKGCDVMVIDDPIDANKALNLSPSQITRWMEQIEGKWKTALRDRFDEPAMSIVIVIMQRLHPKDLAGHFIDHEPGTRVICFPTEYDPEHPYLHPKDPRKKRGELLNPARRGRKWVDDEKTADPHAFACKHQGLPTARGGTLIQRDWFPDYLRWTLAPFVMADRIIAEGGRICMDVDAANEGGASNDDYVCQVTGVWPDGRKTPLDLAEGNWDWMQFRDEVWSLYAKWDSRIRRSSGEVCIEKAAAGHQALQYFKGRIYGLVAFDPRAPEADYPKEHRRWDKVPDKETRWMPWLDEVSRGQWLLPAAEVAPWVTGLLDKWCNLPRDGRDHADVSAQRVLREEIRAYRLQSSQAHWGGIERVSTAPKGRLGR